MFGIQLQQIGRRFNSDWIFRQVDFTFTSGTSYAVLGPNGSGKSTLLKVISGSLTPSEGVLKYTLLNNELPVESVYRHVTIAAPYLELIEEFSLREMIRFHFKNKAYLTGFDEDGVINRISLQSSLDKPLRFFSSGMKQRVKLALACCAQSHFLLLDEPISNLDIKSVDWYHQLVADTVGDRLLIVFSNQEEEYKNCDVTLNIGAFS